MDYEQERKDYRYYTKSLKLISEIKDEHSCQSIIDIGGWNGFFVSRTGISDATCLDFIERPHAEGAEHVTFLNDDFLQIETERVYDICCCMQVLEHVPSEHVTGFARKLFELGKHIVISVPYKWPKGACKMHCQDPVDKKKLRTWTNRYPDSTYVVSEPMKSHPRIWLRRLLGKTNNRRMICYYNNQAMAEQRVHA